MHFMTAPRPPPLTLKNQTRELSLPSSEARAVAEALAGLEAEATTAKEEALAGLEAEATTAQELVRVRSELSTELVDVLGAAANASRQARAPPPAEGHQRSWTQATNHLPTCHRGSACVHSILKD